MFSRLTVNQTSPRPQGELRLFLVLEKPPQPSLKDEGRGTEIFDGKRVVERMRKVLCCGHEV
jgi:hypothetical protein